MSPYTQPAPRGFRWTDTPVARAVLVVLIVLSLGLSIYASARSIAIVDCLQDQATADAKRTKVIAEALDAERAADEALLRGPTASVSLEQLRRAALDARVENNRIRSANPPPAGEDSICR